MNLRSRLALLTGLERQASRWSPEQYRKGMDAYTRLQRLSLVVTRSCLLLGGEELPEPYRGVEEDEALVADMRDRQGFPLPPPIDRVELAEGTDERQREVIRAVPDWLFTVWRFHAPPRKEELAHWRRLRAKDRGHLAPWWVGNLSEAEDPLPWPPKASLLGEYEQRVWQGRFPE